MGKILLNSVRVCVTVGAVLWVLSKINWQDQLHLADGTVLRGRVQRSSADYLVLTRDGRRIHVAGPEVQAAAGLQLGLLSLFKDLRPVYLLVGLLTYPLAVLIGAVRWRLLMQAHRIDPGFAKALRITWVGYFWNLVLPGLTGGDVVKAYCVARRAEKRSASVLTVFLDRVIGLCGLAVLCAMVIVLNLRRPELRAVSGAIMFFLLAVLAAGVLFFSRRLRRRLGLDWLLARLPFQRLVQQLDQALFEYRYHKRTLLATLALSLLVHTVNVGVFYLLGRSLGLPVDWEQYFVFIPVILMIAALPISVGGLGVLEGGVAHFLTLPQVGATVAGAFALCVLYRLTTILAGLPGALLRVDGRPSPASS